MSPGVSSTGTNCSLVAAGVDTVPAVCGQVLGTGESHRKRRPGLCPSAWTARQGVWHCVLWTIGTHQEFLPVTPCSVFLLFSRPGTRTAKGELTHCDLFIPSFKP